MCWGEYKLELILIKTVLESMHSDQECVPPPPYSAQCPLGRLIFKKAMDGVRSPQKVEIPDEDVSHHPWLFYDSEIRKPWMV